MTARQNCPGFSDFAQRPFDDSVQYLGSQFAGGEAHQIQAGEWTASHSVDVTQRIGGTDLSEQIRIVYWRCDKIGGDDQSGLIIQLIDAGIVAGIETNQQVRILILRQCCQ